MVGCYIEVDMSTLEKLKTFTLDELFDALEELEEELDVTDIDKMWDGLHCLLTGNSACEPIENNVLSEAVVGTSLFLEEEEFITYIKPERITDIAMALNQFDIASAIANFNPQEFDSKEIYPSIWLRDDKDKLAEELTFAFEELKQLYQAVSKRGNAVIVSIY